MGEYIFIALVAFICETVDSSLGMGYGTILTPVLILLGYNPIQIIPLILASEFLTGITAAGLHHKVGNVNLTKGSKAYKVAVILSLCSIVGTIIAVFLTVSISPVFVTSYISILLFLIGISNIVLIKKEIKMSWFRVSLLGIIASFNKGISGGGYGPVVTGGQILSGLKVKNTVGITALSESFTCLVGLISYIYLGTLDINLPLGIAFISGALLSVPISVNIIKFINENTLRYILSFIILALSILNFIKIFNLISFVYFWPICVGAFIVVSLVFYLKKNKKSYFNNNLRNLEEMSK